MGKFKEFLKKLNNGYIIAAICVILIGVIVLGLMIGLVARPFATNTAYTAKVKTEVLGETHVTKAKLVLLDGGRYSMTIRNSQKSTYTYFGDYGYGKDKLDTDEERRHNVIWFEYDGELVALDLVLFGGDKTEMVEQKNPFKLQYGGITFTNVGGILLLIIYCVLIAILAAIAAILLVKRNDGKVAITNKMNLIRRLSNLEEMLGVHHE